MGPHKAVLFGWWPRQIELPRCHRGVSVSRGGMVGSWGAGPGVSWALKPLLFLQWIAMGARSGVLLLAESALKALGSFFTHSAKMSWLFLVLYSSICFSFDWDVLVGMSKEWQLWSSQWVRGPSFVQRPQLGTYLIPQPTGMSRFPDVFFKRDFSENKAKTKPKISC